MKELFRRIAQSEVFQSFILFVILVNGVAMGLETYPELNDRYDNLFFFLLAVSQLIFVIEITIRLFAYAPNLGHFFKSFWNTFDFTVVLASLLPAIGPFATVARLCRILRVARLVSVSDELRGVIHRGAAFSRLSASLFIAGVWFYIFSVAGVYLFSEMDSLHWSTLGDSARTLVTGLTLQSPSLFVSYGLASLVFWALLACGLAGCLALIVIPSRVLPVLARLEDGE
jgi:voltage-gated sodium channel